MQPEIPPPVYRFGDVVLDEVAYELRRAGQRVRLARQPMQLLLLLAQRAGELVTRQEIATHLWAPDIFVDVDAGIQTVVFKIRQALGDGAATLVETVPGKGYRLAAPVELVARDTVIARQPPTPPRHNLPPERTSLVGRDRELRELDRLVDGSRLVTLTGPGGVGKTRLGLRCATTLVPRFRDGVWLVDLGAESDGDRLAQLIVRVLGLHQASGVAAADLLCTYLQPRQALLVLDTCEHLVAACARTVDALLRAAPHVRVLATSREALCIDGEVAYRVPPLQLPGAEAATPALAADAVRLFVERAQAVDPAFVPNGAQVDAIVRICRRCEGIPLAIELAAGRIDTLTPAQIDARLQDGFGLLSGGSRTAVARQRTLEATLEWSYRLLSNAERLLLDRLAVFPESWTLEAAESVCASRSIERALILDRLSSLVRKSLVTVQRLEGPHSRYRLLDSVRDFARARLAASGDLDELRNDHFAYVYREFQCSREALLHGQQIAWLRRLRSEQPNVDAALDWGLRSTALREHAVELVAALFWYWIKRSLFADGRLWLERALATEPVGVSRGWIIVGLSRVAYFQGRMAEADAWSTEAVACIAHPAVGEDAWILAYAYHMQAFVRFHEGEHEAATQLAYRAFDAVNLRFGGPLMMLANIARVRQEWETAQGLYDEAITICRRGEDAWALGIVLLAGAGLRIVRGQLAEAHADVREALAYCQQLEDWRGVAWCLDLVAALLRARGHFEDAARAWGATDALLTRLHASLNPEISWIRDRFLESTQRALGDTRFAALHADGRSMSVDEVLCLGGAIAQAGQPNG